MSYYILVIIWGLLIGSFLNVLIVRLPKNQDWILDRSHCSKCSHKLSWWMNIPIISYLFLKGKCFYCKSSISYMYPLIEIINAIKSLSIFYYFGNTLNFNFFYLDLMTSMLIVHFVIDIQHHILPDVINLLILILVIVKIYLTQSWTDSLIGGAVGFGGTFLITYSFYLLRGKIGLGGGDIKLYGIIGLALGTSGIIQNLMLSSLLGICIALVLTLLKKMKLSQPFAFGPSIIIIFTMQLLFPNVFSDVFLKLN